MANIPVGVDSHYFEKGEVPIYDPSIDAESYMREIVAQMKAHRTAGEINYDIAAFDELDASLAPHGTTRKMTVRFNNKKTGAPLCKDNANSHVYVLCEMTQTATMWSDCDLYHPPDKTGVARAIFGDNYEADLEGFPSKSDQTFVKALGKSKAAWGVKGFGPHASFGKVMNGLKYENARNTGAKLPATEIKDADGTVIETIVKEPSDTVKLGAYNYSKIANHSRHFKEDGTTLKNAKNRDPVSAYAPRLKAWTDLIFEDCPELFNPPHPKDKKTRMGNLEVGDFEGPFTKESEVSYANPIIVHDANMNAISPRAFYRNVRPGALFLIPITIGSFFYNPADNKCISVPCRLGEVGSIIWLSNGPETNKWAPFVGVNYEEQMPVALSAPAVKRRKIEADPEPVADTTTA